MGPRSPSHRATIEDVVAGHEESIPAARAHESGAAPRLYDGIVLEAVVGYGDSKLRPYLKAPDVTRAINDVVRHADVGCRPVAAPELHEPIGALRPIVMDER